MILIYWAKTYTIKKNTETVLNASRDARLKALAHAEKRSICPRLVTQCREKYNVKKKKKCSTVQTFGNGRNRSELRSRI